MSQIAKEIVNYFMGCSSYILNSRGDHPKSQRDELTNIIDRHLAGLYERQAETLAIRFVTKALIMDAPFDGGPKYECSLLIEADNIKMARDQATHQFTTALKEAGEEG